MHLKSLVLTVLAIAVPFAGPAQDLAVGEDSEPVQITGDIPDVKVAATVRVRGAGFPIVFPASVALSNDSFIANGEVEIRHGEIGLSPFKAGLGTLKVRDTLVLKYEISGKRVTATE